MEIGTTVPNYVVRYGRAAEWTAPRISARNPGLTVEGYWLNETSFFFLAERLDPSSGLLLSTPSLADAQSGEVVEVIRPEVLLGLLSEHNESSLGPAELANAEFDMPDLDTLAVAIGSQQYLLDRHAPRVRAVKPSPSTPMLYSPDGRLGCFIKGHDIWLEELDSHAQRPLTTDGEALNGYGQQSETCLATVSYRRGPTPVGLWSADSQWFLTHRIDERTLPNLPLIQNCPPAGGRPILHRYKYPMPGDPLPVATYVAIHIASGRVVPFPDFTAPIMVFSAFALRTIWFSGPHTVWLIRQDRYCKQSDLIRLDLTQGSGRLVLSESATSGYIDPHPIVTMTPNVRTLQGSEECIWFSERDGWGHLYLHDAVTGELKHRITGGDWLVRDVIHVDERCRRVFFLAGGIRPGKDPGRRALCSARLDGGDFEIILEHDGDLSMSKTEPCGMGQDRPYRPRYAQAGMSPSARFAVVRYGSVESGNLTRLVDLKTRHGFDIAAALPSAEEISPRQFTATAADGITPLFGTLFLPPDFKESRQYPLIDYIYPGPHVAQQAQSFCSIRAALAKSLAELGFVTLMLDTRGTPGGSRAFHQVGYPSLLEPQLADHVAAVGQLCQRHSFIKADRIGIIGQSAGGTAAVRAMCDHAHVFKVAVAVCGNHDSTYYSANWSDKYRGPGEPQSWASEANAAVVHKLEGKLLLISGDMDENVHVCHTLSLVQALIRANRDFDLLIVPNAGHSVLAVNGYAQRRAWDYFVRHLLDCVPPRNFDLTFSPFELARLSKVSLREFR
jgi:dipeptidyl-peptidase 4